LREDIEVIKVQLNNTFQAKSPSRHQQKWNVGNLLHVLFFREGQEDKKRYL